MISVAMTTFNSTKYLLEQLDSIAGQTVTVDEVIIVDDCSTDNTVDMLEEYISKHGLENWKVYRHESNQGFIRSFRDALTYTRGNIIILCDHDDKWKNNKVEIIKDQFKKELQPGFLATGFCQIDGDGNPVEKNRRKSYSNNDLIRRKVISGQLNKMSFKDLAVYNISPGCTCALTSSIRDEYLNTKVDTLPHDWTMALIAACRKELYYLDIPTTYYRVYDNNVIGLGHRMDLDYRKKISWVNFKEKQDMLSIVEKYKGKKSSEYAYMLKLSIIFKKRYEMLNSGQVFPAAISLLASSMRCGHLYETIVVDAISIIKNKRG